MMNIQWYPGHMTKSRRMMEENLSLVDVVIELLDSRIPYSSKNPDIDVLARNKKRIIVLNKSDLANEKATAAWEKHYVQLGYGVVVADAISGRGVKSVTPMAMELMRERRERDRARGRIFRPVRAMVAGIPNVGKSAFINKFVGKALAKTGDRPGVTRGKQWIRVKKDFELLDTPGILWPKFEDPKAGLNLAITGAINDNILDPAQLSSELIGSLRIMDKILQNRYGIGFGEADGNHEILEMICESRGYKSRGGEPDIPRCGRVILEDFRSGKLGRITLENPGPEAAWE